MRQDAKAQSGDIVHVTEFMKPGPEELLGLLPPKIGASLMRFVERRGWSQVSFPMQVRTTSLFGLARLSLLARSRTWRPRTWRYEQESAWAARWLDLIERSALRDRNVAREIIETADLVKGYGDTYRRGMTNWIAIAERIVEPWLAGRLTNVDATDAILQARLAALADPDGGRLAETIAAIENLTRRAA